MKDPKEKYKVFPHNPYETVINSRPAISFYNDNNPDWLNVMIFYHVLAHIDFFQNNLLFSNTWNEDFVGLLGEAGYAGPSDEAIVDLWFNDLCRSIVLEQEIEGNNVPGTTNQ